MNKYYGYIPPSSFAFTSVKDAILIMIGAICSLECARYVQYIYNHPVKADSGLSKFLPRYALAEWAIGKIDPVVYSGRGAYAKQSLQIWAHTMIEMNTFFRTHNIKDPIEYLEVKKGLIKRSEEHYGWDPVPEKIKEILGVDISSPNQKN